ncbi:alpha/beta hydrolase [Actinomycetospora callitridis]|uniref:alpha/beta hydrolase n=1 Tax=Actinomycetospora callitridis TaxID=913944 RepID=UPI0023673BD8|nr:alpha/beta hydrolase [Actinomycetospora callitridis]MDD7921617.1 alpha/beta hydrolase [Actinomycetospora callitridis]
MLRETRPDRPHNGRIDDQRTATPRAAARSDRHRGVRRRPGARRPLRLSRRPPGQLRGLVRRAGADLPFSGPVEGLPPTLVVSITGDSPTPYPAGIRLAEALGSSLLTVESEQHTVVEAGRNVCVADSTPAYLVHLRTPPADARPAL